MTSRRQATKPRPRIGADGRSVRALALLAVALAAIASGCIYNYDPRDSSYAGPDQRDASDLPTHIAV